MTVVKAIFYVCAAWLLGGAVALASSTHTSTYSHGEVGSTGVYVAEVYVIFAESPEQGEDPDDDEPPIETGPDFLHIFGEGFESGCRYEAPEPKKDYKSSKHKSKKSSKSKKSYSSKKSGSLAAPEQGCELNVFLGEYGALEVLELRSDTEMVVACPLDAVEQRPVCPEGNLRLEIGRAHV